MVVPGGGFVRDLGPDAQGNQIGLETQLPVRLDSRRHATLADDFSADSTHAVRPFTRLSSLCGKNALNQRAQIF
jgi:hypothetical protein